MLSFARARSYPRSNVELSLRDAYSLGRLQRVFDGGFHFQWISHVPRSRLGDFFRVFHSIVIVNGQHMSVARRESKLTSTSTPDSARHADPVEYALRVARYVQRAVDGGHSDAHRAHVFLAAAGGSPSPLPVDVA